MCRASTCHTHPSVRLGESSWRLWIQDHRRHFLTCVEGFGDITPCYVIMRTGCIWSVCGHRLLSGSERRDKDVASRPASSSANLWGEESVCESIPTCAYLCMTRVRAVLSCTQCTGSNSKAICHPLPKLARALTVTQRTAQNTCWDDGDGWQPRRHMGPILALNEDNLT